MLENFNGAVKGFVWGPPMLSCLERWLKTKNSPLRVRISLRAHMRKLSAYMSIGFTFHHSALASPIKLVGWFNILK